MILCGSAVFCGFAAFRAESLWLSVKPETLFAARGEASPLISGVRKAGGFPHGRRHSRKPRERYLMTLSRDFDAATTN